MRAVVLLARSDLRRRWRSVVVLTLLVGFVGAVVLALVGGARRTDTSLARFERFSRSADLEIDVGEVTRQQVEAFRHVPGVAAVAELRQLTLSSGSGLFLPIAAQLDDRFGRVIDRPRVIEGRAVDLTAVDELTIGEALAQQLHLRIGDQFRLESFSSADIEAARSNILPAAHGPDVSFRIVGIIRRPLDLGGRGSAGGVVVPTPAFLARYRDEIGSFGGSILRVRAVHGAADLPRITRAAKRMFGAAPVFSVTSLGIEGQGAQNAIDVTTVGLYLAAGVAAVTGLVGVGIALSREIALADADQLTLSALGLRPRHRAVAAGAIGVPVAIGGALLAVVAALLASPLFPIGVGAQAEPDPGIRVDGVALAIGGISVLLVAALLAAIAGVRTARVANPEREGARLAAAARATSELGAPPAFAAGVRFALDRGQTRHAMPVRSSLLGASFGIVVVVAVLVFSAGLDHLVSTPAAYGWTWDLPAGDTTANAKGNDCGPISTRLVHVAGLSAVASICSSNVEIDGRPVGAQGFGQLRGRIEPTIVEGRAPVALDEVALGAETLAAAGRAVGDRVRITGSSARTFRVVGQVVLTGLSDPVPMADGAVFTAASLARLTDSAGGWNLVVRLAPGVGRAEAVRRLGAIGGPDTGVALNPTLPAEIDRIRRIDGLPVALAGFVGVVALVAVGFALVTTVRRRRRDLAVLKTLGFRRGQVRATVAWHATTVAIVGLVIGIPLGLVVGRFVWRVVADDLGVATDPTWPVLAVVLLIPAAIVAVNLVAAVPASRAARTRPAVVLRSE